MARRQTLMRYLTRTVGVRKAYRVVAFVVAWEIARTELGDEMTVDEYADYWKVSRATGFREQQAFREAFPMLVTPNELIDLAKEQQVPVQRIVFP